MGSAGAMFWRRRIPDAFHTEANDGMKLINVAPDADRQTGGAGLGLRGSASRMLDWQPMAAADTSD